MELGQSHEVDVKIGEPFPQSLDILALFSRLSWPELGKGDKRKTPGVQTPGDRRQPVCLIL